MTQEWKAVLYSEGVKWGWGAADLNWGYSRGWDLLSCIIVGSLQWDGNPEFE